MGARADDCDADPVYLKRLSVPWVALYALAARLALLLLAAGSITAIACGDSGAERAPNLDEPAQTAAMLVDRYLVLVHDKDVEGLQDFLSDVFIIQRADGSHFRKAEYLQNLPDLGEYTTSDVVALQTGDSLVVRWTLAVEQAINGVRFSGDPAPRLSTFVYEDGEWRLSSHANFNVPDASGN